MIQGADVGTESERGLSVASGGNDFRSDASAHCPPPERGIYAAETWSERNDSGNSLACFTNGNFCSLKAALPWAVRGCALSGFRVRFYLDTKAVAAFSRAAGRIRALPPERDCA